MASAMKWAIEVTAGTLLIGGLVSETAGQRAPTVGGRAGARAIGLARGEVDSLLDRVRSDWRVPGIAVGVVRDGRVVLAAGSGVRDLETGQPVTPRTVFAIGSNTKSFTALMAALLVEEGRLTWNRPVRDYLPEFELADPVAARLATLPDLLSHMTGLPRHDGMWYGRSRSRGEILERLRHLPSSATFRERWQYNNLMFLTAGLVAERVTGQSWDELVRRRLLEPLGMTNTWTTDAELAAASELAQPYELRDGAVERVPLRAMGNIAPAGSIGSTVEDMLRYVQVYLDSGRVAGRQVIPAAALRAIQTPRVLMGVDIAGPESEWPELGMRVYAMGLAKTYYRGSMMVLHGGGIDGYTSQMTWMPEHRVGVVVLTNSTTPASEIVTYSLYDRLLGLSPVDWNGRLLAAMRSAPAPAADTAAAGTPSHQLGDYAGQYQHPGYGTIEIEAAGGHLRLRWDRFETGLAAWRYDTFRSGPEARRWGIIPNLASFTVTFRTSPAGRVDRLEIPFEPAVAPLVFERKGPRG